MELKVGSSRVVVLVGKYAVKFPRAYSEKSFLYGMYCNVSERKYCVQMRRLSMYSDLVAPSLFCVFGGFVQIQLKCEPLDRELSIEEREKFQDVSGGDLKSSNFGLLNDKVVCLDYP